ncbi:MAG: MFS transporter [Candidatus Hydrogenedentales bacterium]|jgi:GPH family glycoside/pentoside/hexuronide:cation symporter
MTNPQRREFTWFEGLAFLLSAIGVQLCSEFIAQWGPYFYSPTEGGGRTIYVALGFVLPMFVIGRLFDAVTDPLVGVWSDETRLRPGWFRIFPVVGRRRPFIFWGSILMTVSGIAFWYPPFDGKSVLNFAYGTLLLCLHLGLFTICVVPLNALGPEVARSKEARIKLGQWTAIGMILGLAMAAVLPGVLLKALDPARHRAVAGAGTSYSAAGYQHVAILFAILSLFLFQFAVWAVKERFEESSKNVRAVTAGEVMRDMYSTLGNSVFRKYLAAFFLFSVGFLAVQRVLPNWAEVGLGGDEGTVTLMMLPFIGSALLTALLLAPLLSRRMPMKWQLFLAFLIIIAGLPMMYFIAKAPMPANTKFLLGGVLFFICGIGQGILYVLYTPLLGEIIDLDEQRTGRRREGAYWGAHGVAFKAGQAASIAVSNLCMSLFGNSVENPAGILLVGPISAGIALIGLFVVWTYPILHVTRETFSELITEGPGMQGGR